MSLSTHVHEMRIQSDPPGWDRPICVSMWTSNGSMAEVSVRLTIAEAKELRDGLAKLLDEPPPAPDRPWGLVEVSA